MLFVRAAGRGKRHPSAMNSGQFGVLPAGTRVEPGGFRRGSYRCAEFQALGDSCMRLSESQSPAFDLIARIRTGDRAAAALFMQRFGERIRCRVRAQLGQSMRRLFDSQDILSTVTRRLDEMVCSGTVRASDEGQLLALLLRIANNAVVDKARLLKRLEQVESDDRVVARTFQAAFAQSSDTDSDGSGVITRAFQIIGDPLDRTILSMWLNGLEHAAISHATNLSVEACRFRWHRIRARLREALAPEIEEAA